MLILAPGLIGTYLNVNAQSLGKINLLKTGNDDTLSETRIELTYVSKTHIGFSRVTRIRFVTNNNDYIVAAQYDGHVSLLKLGWCWGSSCIQRMWTKSVGDRIGYIYGISIPRYNCYGYECIYIAASGYYTHSQVAEYKLFDKDGRELLHIRSNKGISELLGYAVALGFTSGGSYESSILNFFMVGNKLCNFKYSIVRGLLTPKIQYYTYYCFNPRGELPGVTYMTLFKDITDTTRLVLASSSKVVLYTWYGSKLWSYNLPWSYGSITKVDAGGSLIAVGTSRGYVILLRATDGSVLWRSKLFRYVALPSLSNDDKVLVAISPFEKKIVISNAFIGGYTVTSTVSYTPRAVDVVLKNSVSSTKYYLVAIGDTRGWVYQYTLSVSPTYYSTTSTSTSTSVGSWSPPSWVNLGYVYVSRSVSSYVSLGYFKWYGFKVYRSGYYRISVSGSGDPDLYVYDCNGNLIKKSRNIGSDYVTIYLNSGRYYFIKVYGYKSSHFTLIIRKLYQSTTSSTTSGAYSQSPWTDLGYIYSIKTVNSYVSTRSSKLYRFRVYRSGYYSITVSGSGDPDLYIYDSNWNLIKKSTRSGSDSLNLYLRRGVHYFIKVYGFEGGSFTLTIRRIGYTPSTTITTSSTTVTSSSWHPPISWSYIGYVYSLRTVSSYVTSGGFKWYGFKVYRSGYYVISVSSTSSYGDPDLYVYDSSGNLIGKSKLFGNDRVEVYLRANHYYYIMIFGYRGGSYTLTIKRS